MSVASRASGKLGGGGGVSKTKIFRHNQLVSSPGCVAYISEIGIF